MTVINLKKAIEEVRLGEEENAPVFYIDLTDKAITANVSALREKFSEYKKQIEFMTPGESITSEQAELIASVFRDVIETMMGAGSFERVVAYVSDGRDYKPTEIIILLTPLFIHLQGLLNSVMQANFKEAAAKYHAV